MWRRRGLLAAITAVIVAVSADAAGAEVRAAVVNDGADSGIAFDLRQIEVAIDRDSGTIAVALNFHQPIPEPTAAPLGSGVVLWIGDDCSGLQDDAGEIYLNVGPGFLNPQYRATVNVSFRREYPDIPVEVSPDRTRVTLATSDPLIIGSNPRCLTGHASGRIGYDPSQPGGGSTLDEFDDRWFEGFDPDDPRNRAFTLAYSARNPQRLLPRSRGRYANLQHTTRCSLACTLRIRGYATTPAQRRLPGLVLEFDDEAEENESAMVGYGLTSIERRRLARALARYRRVRYVLRITATDPIGRIRRITRTIILLPQPKPARRASSSPSSSNSSSGGGDRDCSDFATERAAQDYFVSRGGSSSNNVDNLDADHDGRACEALP